MGVALGYLGNFIVRRVRSWGLENTTFHVLFEVFVPFIVYLVANALGTSGIIAVVAAGILNVVSPRTIGPSVSRMNIVSTNVWRVLAFALNGIVFVLLGTQLPRAMQRTWENVTIDNGVLIGYILGITALMLAVRFVWVFAMERLHRQRTGRMTLDELRSTAVMTLAGPKGTITLAVAFTIPFSIPQRELLLFLACGVIVVTMLLATFVVPLIAPKKEPEDEEQFDEEQASIEMLRSVVEELAARQTSENRAATQMVIRAYNERIAHLKNKGDVTNESMTPVSYTHLNKAYAVLRDEGYVLMRGRSGAYIADPCEEDRADRAQIELAKMEDALFELALAHRARGGSRGEFLECASAQAARAYAALERADADSVPSTQAARAAGAGRLLSLIHI